MSCDLCGRATNPGESICWDCVEDVSQGRLDEDELEDELERFEEEERESLGG